MYTLRSRTKKTNTINRKVSFLYLKYLYIYLKRVTLLQNNFYNTKRFCSSNFVSQNADADVENPRRGYVKLFPTPTFFLVLRLHFKSYHPAIFPPYYA